VIIKDIHAITSESIIQAAIKLDNDALEHIIDVLSAELQDRELADRMEDYGNIQYFRVANSAQQG